MKEQIDDEIKYLDLCIKEFEIKLKWGKKDEWTNHHFKQLNEDIASKTGVSLSISSIRRIFGQDKSYKEKFNPQIETKNTLAKYLGFENWADFKVKNKPTKKFIFQSIISNKKVLILSISFILIICTTLIFIWIYNRTHPQVFYFSGRNLEGIAPHTIAFNYDISNLKGNLYSIDFGELYNPSGKKVKIPKEEHIITHTYFNSGYYNVALINNKNKEILTTEKVMVLSKGWESGGINDEEYFIIPTEYLKNKKYLYISTPELAKSGVDSTKEFKVEFKYINNININADSFTLQSKIKFSKVVSFRGCYKVRLIINTTLNPFYIEFANKGCAPDLSYYISDNSKNGKIENMEQFTADIFDWANLKIENKSKNIILSINNKKILNTSYNQSLGQIKGIQFLFSGNGAIDDFILQNGKKDTVLTNTFE